MSMGDVAYVGSQCYDVSGQAHMMCIISFDQYASARSANRAVAITRNGKTVEGYTGSSSGTGHATIMEMVFPVRTADIREIRLQTRPWNQWAEIRHIAINADQHTHIEIVTSDNPAAPAK